MFMPVSKPSKGGAQLRGRWEGLGGDRVEQMLKQPVLSGLSAERASASEEKTVEAAGSQRVL